MKIIELTVKTSMSSPKLVQENISRRNKAIVKTDPEQVYHNFQSVGPLGLCFLLVDLSVGVSVCVYVCSLLRYNLNVFLPPLPKIGCAKF